MYGQMSDKAIDELLRRHYYGRLGFSLDGEIYIIPINYAFDGTRLYGQAIPGTKVSGMRQNPHIALEVDEISDPAQWRSVLVHGRFVEVRAPGAKQEVFQRICDQAGASGRSQASWTMGVQQLVSFFIEITSWTGRFEERAFLDTNLGFRVEDVHGPPLTR